MSAKKTILFAGLFGNALEWYDFILFANFAPIIANLFFPVQNPVTSVLLTFAVFATGFIVRPVGAVLFGYIGDHLGRRIALITSISLITIPTLMIGCIPSYASIGLAAPVILTILRLLQGFAISGELNSATTYLVEHASDSRRGFAGSLVMSTANMGMFFGAFISFTLMSTLNTEALYSWGWRVPFWLSGLMGVAGFVLRIRTQESPRFLEEKAEEIRTPLKLVFLQYRKELFVTFFLTSVMAVGNYILIAYVMTFLVKSQQFTLQSASIINMITMFTIMVVTPLMGILSDRFGRKPMFKSGLLAIMVFALPIFWMLTQKTFILALAGDILLGLVLTPIAGLIPTLVAELFPTQVRNSGSTIGYNVCLAIFGGTAPLISMALVSATGSHYAPGIYLMGCAVVSSIALYFIDDRNGKPLT